MSPTDGLGTLIAAPMPGVDVSLFDGQLRPLEPTLRDNEFSWRVPAGLYKIRYQAGSSIHEELVALDDVTTPQRLPQPRLEVTSAAPLRNTSSTHQYHEGPAAADSRGAPDALGQGARLFALVRSRGGAFKRPEPLRGLTLVREGRTVLRFDQARRGGNDTCATFHIEVDPGPYTLRYAMTDVTLEQTLFLADRWQTQLFISEAPDDEPAALDMPGLGVLMARIGAGFDPRRPDLQITELARKALRRGQSTLGSEQIRYLLREKFENPMLGVLVAHLLLAHHERGGLLDEVLDNTADLIPGHPDVDCLLSATERRVPAALACPPMLTRSWQLLVRGEGQAAMGIATEDHLADMALSQWDTGGT